MNDRFSVITLLSYLLFFWEGGVFSLSNSAPPPSALKANPAALLKFSVVQL